MANYHTDEFIMQSVMDHYNEALDYFPKDKIVGIMLQGSQNYELDYKKSDIDTKLIVLPSFRDFVLNKQPVSTTHVRANNEHTDFKDIRLMFDCFRKQNINFLEILFTKYKYINPQYRELFQPMFDNAEKIAHYNNFKAVSAIAGMVEEKYHALEHPYPACKDDIDKYGYSPKQLHHIFRCEEFLKRFTSGESYSSCLISNNPHMLLDIKANVPYTLDGARKVAEEKLISARMIKEDYMASNSPIVDREVDDIMNDVLYNIMKKSFEIDIKKD